MKIKKFLIIIINLILISLIFTIKVKAENLDLETTLKEIQEKGRENFEENIRNTFPEFFKTGIYINQGYNYFLFENTCGQTVSATAFNILFDTNFFSENMFVDLSVNNNLCDVKYFEEKKRGSQTASQVVSTLKHMSYNSKKYVKVKNLELNEFLNEREIIEFIKNKGLIIQNISSDILWNNTFSEPNHWILITGYTLDSNNNIKTLKIVDTSGSNINEITKQQYIDCSRGYKNNKFKKNNMILIRKKDFKILKKEKLKIKDIFALKINRNQKIININPLKKEGF